MFVPFSSQSVFGETKLNYSVKEPNFNYFNISDGLLCKTLHTQSLHQRNTSTTTLHQRKIFCENAQSLDRRVNNNKTFKNEL